ncbi:hypothetical protein QTP86_027205, partial [Hemibagrus guttatus]
MAKRKLMTAQSAERVNAGSDRKGACAYLLGIKAGYTLDGVPTHRRVHTHTHTLRTRDANQPTMHVFGLGEETGVPGGNPRGTGRTCKLHTHGGGRNRIPNPGGGTEMDLWDIFKQCKEINDFLA